MWYLARDCERVCTMARHQGQRGRQCLSLVSLVCLTQMYTDFKFKYYFSELTLHYVLQTSSHYMCWVLLVYEYHYFQVQCRHITVSICNIWGSFIDVFKLTFP